MYKIMYKTIYQKPCQASLSSL